MVKKLLVVLVVVCLCSTVALAFDPMGPPLASQGKGNSSIGVDGSWTNTDMTRQPTDWSSANRWVKIKMYKVFGTYVYGLADNVDVFVRAGAGTLEWEKQSGRSYCWEGDDGDWDFIWGAGMRATLVEAPDVSWGFLAQFSDGTLTGSKEEDEYDYKGSYRVSLTEIQLAAGPTWNAAQGLKIYGGPFINLISGKFEEYHWGDKPRKPINEESWLGAYVGAQCELAPNCLLNIEWIQTQDGRGAAAGLIFRQ